MKSNLNILIPMAGTGSRFSKSHPNQIKPLINIVDRSMIEMALSNLNQLDGINFIIVTTKKIGENQEFINVLKKLNLKYQLILIEELTKGPASTCLLAKEFIDNDDPLIIANCDQYIIDFNLRNLIDFANINSADGVIGVFHSNSKKNSYVKLAEDFTVQEIKEKIVISNIATNGLHFWKHGKDFISSSEQMVSLNDKYSNEFYVAPSYNYLIKEGKKIIPFYYNLHCPIGIPEDLISFEEKIYDYIKH
jgi:dTDP-glucose pyrophosphorylase